MKKSIKVKIVPKLKVVREKQRKTVPICSKANPWHDPDTGEFTSKDKAGSWSIRKDTVKDGRCSQGQNQVKGGKRLFVRKKCGRLNPDSPNTKGPYRCRDGSKLQESDWVKIKKKAFQRLVAEIDLSDDDEIIDENMDDSKVKAFCNSKGYFNIQQWLQHMNAIEQSKDGKLGQKATK